ncbi:hypothetical protein GJ496_007072 [Pomphorhynchus laevis]|nr:hypothetical protein GJ496_007072 [Pomphorhynchus laevis]
MDGMPTGLEELVRDSLRSSEKYNLTSIKQSYRVIVVENAINFLPSDATDYVSRSETNDLHNFSYSTTIFEDENVLDRIWPSNILQKISSACETEICPSKISYGQKSDHLKEAAMPETELHKVDLIYSNSNEVWPSVTGHGKERDPVLNISTDKECDSIEHISAQISKEIIPESSESANDVCDHEPFEPLATALQLLISLRKQSI